MAISYKKLWIVLIEKDLKKTDLKALCKLGPNTLAKLGKNESVSMEVLQKICRALGCNIGDIVDYIPD
ncbi:MAG: helix-turn-helix transcriptional regulator [Clostridiales bacterium]|nr:helix-turn-helix transcriptional regulator [Clostridiales bacterium]